MLVREPMSRKLKKAWSMMSSGQFNGATELDQTTWQEEAYQTGPRLVSNNSDREHAVVSLLQLGRQDTVQKPRSAEDASYSESSRNINYDYLTRLRKVQTFTDQLMQNSNIRDSPLIKLLREKVPVKQFNNKITQSELEEIESLAKHILELITGTQSSNRDSIPP